MLIKEVEGDFRFKNSNCSFLVSYMFELVLDTVLGWKLSISKNFYDWNDSVYLDSYLTTMKF